MKLPGPNATRAEVDAFLREQRRESHEPAHEAPPVANGPSIVCNACGIVRVKWTTPFCKGCKVAIGMA
jgi:hypothetical protein